MVNQAEQDNFHELFEQSIASCEARAGSIVKGLITYIDESKGLVVVDAGLKTDAVIPLIQFCDEQGETDIQVGDEVCVMVELADDGGGETRLSREKAKRAEDWEFLKAAHESNEYVDGVVEKAVKGGLTVALKSIKAFLPGSLVDIRPVRDLAGFVGETLELKIVKVDEKRNNMVVSRRDVIQKEHNLENQVAIEQLAEGQEIEGIVKNITDYGVFVDLGGIDGLLHITDIAWKRVSHPSEMFNVGDKARVKILKIDREKGRVSLGIKQLTEDPWLNLVRRYPVNTRLFGKVTNLTDYGCFVEIEDGIEGLVHMSEMDWTNKNAHPSKIVSLGKEVEVMVLEINEDRRRISLGIKQCMSNPWDTFAQTHKEGTIVKGEIRSITDFGVFIGLDGNIDGLVHLSDISWTQSGQEAIREFEKGQEVEAIILALDPERERISLGIKQLADNPAEKFLSEHPYGSSLTGKVAEVTTGRALLDVGFEMKAQLLAENSDEKLADDMSAHLEIDQEVEVYILGVDRRVPVVNVSSKKPPKHDPSRVKKEAVPSADEPKAATLGDLIKEQMKNDGDEE